MVHLGGGGPWFTPGGGGVMDYLLHSGKTDAPPFLLLVWCNEPTQMRLHSSCVVQ